MNPEFLAYLFGELKDHIEQLREAASDEDPNDDRAEYHFVKASGIVERLEKLTENPIVQFSKVIGGQ